MSERYRCRECGDEMHPKFRRSHDAICAWRTPVDQREVEAFLQVMFP